jgi:hypothetical protein
LNEEQTEPDEEEGYPMKKCQIMSDFIRLSSDFSATKSKL